MDVRRGSRWGKPSVRVGVARGRGIGYPPRSGCGGARRRVWAGRGDGDLRMGETARAQAVLGAVVRRSSGVVWAVGLPGPRVAFVARRAGYLLASLLTVAFALRLVWEHVRPGVIESVSTPALFGMFAMPLAPVLTLMALRQQRLMRAHEARLARPESDEDSREVTRHLADDRSSRARPRPHSWRRPRQATGT